MSLQEDFEKALVETQKSLPNWREAPKWVNIRGITRENLLNGTGCIDKLKYPPWDKRNSDGGRIDPTVGFGKYAEKEVSWVKEHDYRYFIWMKENIPKFAAKVKLLEILWPTKN